HDMPSAITWEAVQADFKVLEDQGVYSQLNAGLEQIRILINSKPADYPPEVVKILIELVGDMNNQFGRMARTTQGDPGKKQVVREVLKQAKAIFDQNGWTVENVTQAQNIYNFTFGPIMKAAEEPKPNI